MGATANNESSKQNHHLRTDSSQGHWGGNIYVSSFVDLLCFFCIVFAKPLCASVYMCLVVTCWERTDLFVLVSGV